jgi:hypothetical protein
VRRRSVAASSDCPAFAVAEPVQRILRHEQENDRLGLRADLQAKRAAADKNILTVRVYAPILLTREHMLLHSDGAKL